MSNDLKCNYCYGTGQKVEMRPVKFGQKLPPYQLCPSCGGTGLPPKPVKVSGHVKSEPKHLDDASVRHGRRDRLG